MSHYMTALAMKQRGLKPAAKIVLYWLADHHNSETGMCFPSLKTLAKECEMDVATVKRHLIHLEDAGLIERNKRHRENGSQTSTQYILRLFEGLAQNAPTPGAKCATPLAQNNTPHNLGNNNLGNEPNISAKADDRFDEFWQTVPRKVGKGQAVKAWRSALKKADADTILAAMRAYALQREGQDQQFTAHPATWLNGERWLDEAPQSPADFYNQIQQHLSGGSNALSGPDQNSGNYNHRLSAPVSAPASPRQRSGAAGNISDSRGGERPVTDYIKPRRI